MNKIKGYIQLSKCKSVDIFNFNFIKYNEKRFYDELLSKVPKFEKEYNKLITKYKTHPKIIKFHVNMIYKGKSFLGGCCLSHETAIHTRCNIFEMMLRMIIGQIEDTTRSVDGVKRKKRKLKITTIK